MIENTTIEKDASFPLFRHVGIRRHIRPINYALNKEEMNKMIENTTIEKDASFPLSRHVEIRRHIRSINYALSMLENEHAAISILKEKRTVLRAELKDIHTERR